MMFSLIPYLVWYHKFQAVQANSAVEEEQVQAAAAIEREQAEQVLDDIDDIILCNRMILMIYSFAIEWKVYWVIYN